MFGQSIRKCGYPLLVQRGTFPVSIASRLTLPNARNGTARTPLQFYPLKPFHFSRRRTANTTRRSQKFRFAGSRLVQSTSADLLCVGVTPKHFMLRLYRKYHPLPRKTSLGVSTNSQISSIFSRFALLEIPTYSRKWPMSGLTGPFIARNGSRA